jgi:hypothetical protein
VRRRARLAGALVVGAAATWGLAIVIAALARSAGYLRQDYPVALIKLDQLGDAFDGLVDASRQLWASPPDGLGRAAGDVGMVLLVAAIVIGVVVLVRALMPSLRAASARDPLELQRSMWSAFWLTALLGFLAAFLLVPYGGLAGVPSVRYLFGVPLAVAAGLAPLGAVRLGRVPVVPAVGAVTAVLALMTAAVFVQTPPAVPAIQGDLSRSALFSTIERVAAQEHVTRGFASYWTSYPLVLHSGRTLDVTPAGTCGTEAAFEVCAMYLHYVDQAYAPQPGIRSFLLVDESDLAGAGFSGAWVQRLPQAMRPVKVIPIGDGMEMAIFDHDVAADLKPNGGLQDPRIGRGGPLDPR